MPHPRPAQRPRCRERSHWLPLSGNRWQSLGPPKNELTSVIRRHRLSGYLTPENRCRKIAKIGAKIGVSKNRTKIDKTGVRAVFRLLGQPENCSDPGFSAPVFR